MVFLVHFLLFRIALKYNIITLLLIRTTTKKCVETFLVVCGKNLNWSHPVMVAFIKSTLKLQFYSDFIAI